MTMKVIVSKNLLLIPTTKKSDVYIMHNMTYKIPLEIIAFSLCSEFSITTSKNELNSEEYMYSHFKCTPKSPYLRPLPEHCTPSGKPLRLAKQWRMLILCWFKFLTQFFKWPGIHSRNPHLQVAAKQNNSAFLSALWLPSALESFQATIKLIWTIHY